MKLFEILDFNEDEVEEEEREAVFCKECGKTIGEEFYFDDTNRVVYCSYACYIKTLRAEYFD